MTTRKLHEIRRLRRELKAARQDLALMAKAPEIASALKDTQMAFMAHVAGKLMQGRIDPPPPPPSTLGPEFDAAVSAVSAVVDAPFGLYRGVLE